MALRTPLDGWTLAFFTTLGLAPLVACSGTTVSGANGREGSGDGGPAGAGGSTGGGGRGGVTGSGGAGGASDGGIHVACINPTDVKNPDGSSSGFVRCADGAIHRPVRNACASGLPRPAACPGAVTTDGGAPLAGSCVHDSDCTELPNGYCAGATQGSGCYCNYGCMTDGDCVGGELCLCNGGLVGQCVAAGCTGDDACATGSLCASYMTTGCGARGTEVFAFMCQTPGDQCLGDGDCPSGTSCTPVNGQRLCTPWPICLPGTGGGGRPFLVLGIARLADVAMRRDWTSPIVPSVTGLDAATRRALAARWTEIGLMEHASIAAFARLALELLSLGAPPELLAATQQAMMDETAHARDAFALASAYAGEPIGPGALDVGAALVGRTPREIVRTAVLEGCIGETVAAVEAAESLARATDPAVRAALTRITADETRHAELSWRFVRWALSDGDSELREHAAEDLVRTVEAELVTSPPPLHAVTDHEAWVAETLCPSMADVQAHGVLGAEIRDEIRRRVLSEIVLPCARALAGGTRLGSDGPKRTHAA